MTISDIKLELKIESSLYNIVDHFKCDSALRPKMYKFECRDTKAVHEDIYEKH